MRASGKIGVATDTETRPGIWENVITENDYIGEVVTRTETLDTGDAVLPKYRTTTSVSVLSEGVQKLNYSDMRYLTYLGMDWTIASVVFQYPRLILYLGEEYHGPKPVPTE